MLVLSRRPDQKIVFPSVGITIELLKIRGGVAKIGIDAPRELQVLREEVFNNESGRSDSLKLSKPAGATDRHELRNQLNAANLAVHLAQRQISSGESIKAAETLETIIDRFRKADKMMAQMQTRRQRALLVDDDLNERELLAAYLKSFGYEIETASNGMEALQYLQAHELPDIVLLDMTMPVCDGPAAVQHIRELPEMRDLKVFGVSGKDPDEAGVSIGPEGVNAWFKKPLNPEELVGRIRSEISKSMISA